MKAFSFRLESLLHLRESAREKSLVGYAKSIQNRQKIESELKNLEASLEKLHRDITSRRSSSLEASADQSFQKAVLSLKQNIVDCHAKLEDLKQIELSKKNPLPFQSIELLSLRNSQDPARLS